MQKGDTQYRYYSTGDSDNGAYTAAYYTAKLADCGLISQEDSLPRLYDLEYTMLAAGLGLDGDLQAEIIQTKQELKQVVDELEEVMQSDDDDEQSVTIQDRFAPAVADLETSVDEMLAKCDHLNQPEDRFEYVPNLMLDANLQEIIGPFCMDRIEDIIGHHPDDCMLRGYTTEEPGGSKIIEVTRNGLRLLVDLDVLVVEETGILRHNTARAKDLFDEAIVEDLFKVEHVVDDGRTFLDTFENTCIEKANDEGVVFWPDIVDAVTQELGISRNEMDREIESRVARGQISFVPEDMGQPYHDSPPGLEASFVLVEFQ